MVISSLSLLINTQPPFFFVQLLMMLLFHVAIQEGAGGLEWHLIVVFQGYLLTYVYTLIENINGLISCVGDAITCLCARPPPHVNLDNPPYELTLLYIVTTQIELAEGGGDCRKQMKILTGLFVNTMQQQAAVSRRRGQLNRNLSKSQQTVIGVNVRYLKK